MAVGKLVCLGVFGNDYDTPDGTCVRDYIHVVDLADGHVKALDKLAKEGGVWIYNLGTGVGYSVLDVINAFEEANHLKINYVFKERRAGDVPQCYADSSKAERELGWKAKIRHPGDVRGFLEMAEEQSERIRRKLNRNKRKKRETGQASSSLIKDFIMKE